MSNKDYNDTKKMVTRMVTRWGGSLCEAEDTYHDALVILLNKQKGGDFKFTSKPSTFLFGVSRNVWMEKSRSRGRLVFKDEYEAPFHDTSVETKDRNRAIQEMMDSLDKGSRDVLYYSYFEGRTGDEITKLTGYKTAKTVKSKKYKATKKLERIVKTNYTIEDLI